MGVNNELLFIGLHAEAAALHFNASKPSHIPELTKLDTSVTKGTRRFGSDIYAVCLSDIPEALISKCASMECVTVMMCPDQMFEPILWSEYLDEWGGYSDD